MNSNLLIERQLAFIGLVAQYSSESRRRAKLGELAGPRALAAQGQFVPGTNIHYIFLRSLRLSSVLMVDLDPIVRAGRIDT